MKKRKQRMTRPAKKKKNTHQIKFPRNLHVNRITNTLTRTIEGRNNNNNSYKADNKAAAEYPKPRGIYIYVD